MRILMFGWEFPPYLSGGLGTACYDMTKALAHKGTKIIFVQPKVEGADKIRIAKGLTLRSASGQNVRRVSEKLERAATELWKKNIDIKNVDSALIPYATPETYEEYLELLLKDTKYKELREHSSSSTVINLRGGYGRDLMSEVYRFSYAAASIAMELAGSYDIIHVHDWMTYPAGVLAKQMTGKPLIAHAHSLEYDRSGDNLNGQVAHIEWEGLSNADKVVAVSHYTKNLIVKHYNIDENKIEVVHNAVTRASFAKQFKVPELCRDEKLVLFLGRITFQKGPEYFVEAARLVLNKLPNTRFVMGGSGDMLLNIVRRVGQLRMGDHFHFTGFMNRQEIERIYAMSDLYCMPSVSEPFGITPLEAMTSDVPVLISRQSGVSEVLHGALKVDFWDVKEMANKICAILSYPVLAAEVVKRCQEDLKNIKWENAAQHLNDIYSQCV
jgi:glycosyltransferase involved in cell wall biosynthesis